MLCFVLCSVVAMASSLKGKGNIKCLKENASAVLVLDFSNARWENDEDFKQWCGNSYEERVAISTSEFTRSFNECNKGLKIVNKENNAKYKILIELNNFVRKVSGWGWGRAHIKIYGVLKIIDVASGKPVCTYDIDGVAGGNDYVETDRFAKSFEELGKELAK